MDSTVPTSLRGTFWTCPPMKSCTEYWSMPISDTSSHCSEPSPTITRISEPSKWGDAVAHSNTKSFWWWQRRFTPPAFSQKHPRSLVSASISLKTVLHVSWVLKQHPNSKISQKLFPKISKKKITFYSPLFAAAQPASLMIIIMKYTRAWCTAQNGPGAFRLG